jgi:hypothetical protein
MRVERALGKLHAALSRHGVTSTSAALAAALAAPAAIAAPASLAAALTGAALTAASVGGTAAAAGGLIFMTMNKTVTVVAGSVALLAGGAAYVQTDRLRDAEAAQAAAVRQAESLNGEMAKMSERLRLAERRAAEVEKDNADLLRAVEAVRLQQAAVAQQAKAAATAASARPVDEQQRLADERAYGQEVARRRMAETRQALELDEALNALEPSRRYEFLLAAAEKYAGTHEFQLALKTFNRAMSLKPPEVAVGDAAQALRASLQAQSKPVDVTLMSDGMTSVMIVDFMSPSNFGSKAVKMLPGDYQVIGRRRGYQDVNLTMQVRGEGALPPVHVICTVPVAP